jgi:hypothetical protein
LSFSLASNARAARSSARFVAARAAVPLIGRSREQRAGWKRFGSRRVVGVPREVGHVRRGIDRAQATIQLDRIALHRARETMREVHLVELAGRDELARSFDAGAMLCRARVPNERGGRAQARFARAQARFARAQARFARADERSVRSVRAERIGSIGRTERSR